MTPDAHDENADFVDWVASRQHGLLRTAYLMTGDLHRAEDLLQDALVKVADRWRRVRDGNPDAYIRTILYRDNVSWWRKRRESPVAQVRDVVARKSFPFTPSCCDNPFNVVGIDAAGRVFADGGGLTWVWDTGSIQVVRGLGRTGYVTEATADGVVVTLDPRSKEDSPVALVGKVNGDGRFVEQVRVDGVASTVSWDGPGSPTSSVANPCGCAIW